MNVTQQAVEQAIDEWSDEYGEELTPEFTAKVVAAIQRGFNYPIPLDEAVWETIEELSQGPGRFGSDHV